MRHRKALLLSFLGFCVLIQSLSLPTDQIIHGPNDTQPVSLPSGQDTIINNSTQSLDAFGAGPIIPPQFSYDAMRTAAKQLRPDSFRMNVLDLMAQLAAPDTGIPADQTYRASGYDDAEIEVVDYQGRLEKRFAIWGLFNLLVLNSVTDQPFFIQSLMVLYWKEDGQARQRVGTIAIRARQPGLESSGGSENVTLSRRSSPPSASETNLTGLTIPLSNISGSPISITPDQDSMTNASGTVNAPRFNAQNLIYSDEDISPTKVFILACGLITSIINHDPSERPSNGMLMYIPIIDATVTYSSWPPDKPRKRPPYWTYGNAPIGLALGGRGFLASGDASGEYKEMTTLLWYGKTELAAAQFRNGNQGPHS